MPAPVVYAVFGVVVVVAAGIAFHEFVYEPHIAPKFEAWAESYIEGRRRNRRQRQGPVPAQLVEEHDDENRSRRSSASDDDLMGAGGASIELEQFETRERDARGHNINTSGLRHRRPAGGLDESNTFIPHPVLEPTHVIFDNSEPPSPGGHSIRTSVPTSLDNSPAHSAMELQPTVVQSPSPSSRVELPRLPTPISLYSSPSPSPPPMTLPERSPLSSRRHPPDIGASQASPSAFHTPLGGSVVFEEGRTTNDPLSQLISIPASRIQSPFSDIHSVDARSSPEHVSAARSPFDSPRVQSPSIASDLTLDSDDEFDVLSPRSGIISPTGHFTRVDDDPFDAESQHEGSEMSWASVDGRRSPVDF